MPSLAHLQSHILERAQVRTLRFWINRFNELGIDALTYCPRLGRPRSLDAELVRSQIIPLIDTSSQADQGHWTSVKLCGWGREHKEVTLCYSTLVRYLHEHDYARRVSRPMPESPELKLWDHLVPKLLPPYRPGFNSIERFGQRIKSYYMAGFITNQIY